MKSIMTKMKWGILLLALIACTTPQTTVESQYYPEIPYSGETQLVELNYEIESVPFLGRLGKGETYYIRTPFENLEYGLDIGQRYGMGSRDEGVTYDRLPDAENLVNTGSGKIKVSITPLSTGGYHVKYNDVTFPLLEAKGDYFNVKKICLENNAPVDILNFSKNGGYSYKGYVALCVKRSFDCLGPQVDEIKCLAKVMGCGIYGDCMRESSSLSPPYKLIPSLEECMALTFSKDRCLTETAWKVRDKSICNEISDVTRRSGCESLVDKMNEPIEFD